MKNNSQGFAWLVPVAIIAAVVLAGGYIGAIHIPFIKTKADVQAELKTEKQAHQLDKSELVAQTKLTADQAQLLLDLKKAAESQALLTQSASNAVSKITATFELSLPANRKELVISYASQEAAKALPPPTNYAETLKIVKGQLNEALTTNAQLATQHNTDLGVIAGQQQALDKALAEVKTQQAKVDEQTALNAKQKAENDQTRAALDSKNSLLSQALAGLDRFKYSVMAIVGLAGLLCVGAGVLLHKPLLIAKGVLGIILSGLGMIIPLTWYLAAVGLLMLAVVVYVVSQWHKEKTVADNSVGILQEVKQKLPEVWDATIRPLTKQYWGVAVKDVAKADKWVDQKLEAMNFLPKQ